MAAAFARRLAQARPATSTHARRRWLFVPYDQLTDVVGPLSREPVDELGIVLVESPAKAARRPYHQQKLAFVLANLRWFALEQAERGVAVRHVVDDRGYGPALRDVAAELGPLRMMRAAERELRVELAPLVAEGLLELLPHEGWLTSRETFTRSQDGAPPYRMDAFYREVRREHDVLMDGGKPVGGKFSFDAENRKPWKGEPAAPTPPTFPRDDIKDEVAALIEARFGDHPGRVDIDHLPATRADAEALWHWAVAACLPHFGPFEDAFSTRSAGLFHGRLSPLINVLRLLPARVVAEVEAMDLPLPTQEGFLRQVWGWREFVRHVHEATDGFRDLTGEATAAVTGGDARHAIAATPADGDTARDASPATPDHLGADRPLPPAFWEGAPSGLACLDHVVADVWAEAWSHHITRLMVLCNLGTLLDVSPRELTDWFWVAYVDAYDWVVEPNVLGMGTFATGELMTTKPYVSGAAYLNKMGDACKGCAFDPKRSCPITPLYWAFLERHEEQLASNPRLRMPYASLRKRGDERRAQDRRVAEDVIRRLAVGELLTPEGLGA